MKNKKILYAIFGIVFAIFLVIVTIEIFFTAFPQLLPHEFGHIKYVTYDSVLGSKLKPDYHIVLNNPDSSFIVDTINYRNIGLRDDGFSKTYGLVIGDSFVFGDGVNLTDSIPETLERRTGKDFVNMGVPGYGTEHEYRILENYGFQLNPKVVILIFHDSDFLNNEGLLRTPNQEIRNWLRENSVTYEIFKYLQRKFENSEQFDESKVIYYTDKNFDLAFFKAYWPNKAYWENEKLSFGYNAANEKFSQMKKDTEKRNIKFIAFYMPTKELVYSEFIKEKSYSYDFDSGKQLFFSICKNNQIECYDLTHLLRNQTQQIYFKYDGHLNKRGNEVVAEEIFRLLKSNNLTE